MSKSNLEIAKWRLLFLWNSKYSRLICKEANTQRAGHRCEKGYQGNSNKIISVVFLIIRQLWLSCCSLSYAPAHSFMGNGLNRVG